MKSEEVMLWGSFAVFGIIRQDGLFFFAVFAYWIEPRKIEGKAGSEKDYLDAIAMMRVKLSQSCWESLATPHARPDKGSRALRASE